MPCNRCGAAIYSGLQICPHCGARQKKRSSHTTCAHCHHRASSGSSVCPRCGHVLRARRPPAGLLFVVALVALTAVVLTVDMFTGGWQQLRVSVEEKVAMAEMQVNDVGGKVLDAASSLADGEIADDQTAPTQVVVLQELADDAPLLELQALPTQPPSLVVAPTTVGEAIGGPPNGSTPSPSLLPRSRRTRLTSQPRPLNRLPRQPSRRQPPRLPPEHLCRRPLRASRPLPHPDRPLPHRFRQLRRLSRRRQHRKLLLPLPEPAGPPIASSQVTTGST